jgi:hypothetical protein
MAIFGFLLFVLQLAILGVTVYGICLSFKKHWALRLTSVFIPGFALVVGGAKLLLKKELLA